MFCNLSAGNSKEPTKTMSKNVRNRIRISKLPAEEILLGRTSISNGIPNIEQKTEIIMVKWSKLGLLVGERGTRQGYLTTQDEEIHNIKPLPLGNSI